MSPWRRFTIFQTSLGACAEILREHKEAMMAAHSAFTGGETEESQEHWALSSR